MEDKREIRPSEPACDSRRPTLAYAFHDAEANGSSLFGLAEALKGQGKHHEEAEVRRRFEAAFARADIKLGLTSTSDVGHNEGLGTE